MTNFSRLYIFLLLAQLSQAFVFASEIYTWKNDKGIVVFSDTPKPDAKTIDIKEPNTIKYSVDTANLNHQPTKKTPIQYHVNINQPLANSTVRDNTGAVYVSGQVKPTFNRNFKIQLYIDNKPYQSPQTSTVFSLQNIDRGEHQIKMLLLGDKGKVIASSIPITFYMHRNSVKHIN